MTTIGAVVISRNDNYGGDLAAKFTYGLTSLLYCLDEVYYIDWNSPEDKTLFEEVRQDIPKTGKLRIITVTQNQAKQFTNNNPDVQYCCEVLARNIGLRRLSTDYLISTNSDIMVTTRENILSGIQDENTFHTIARTTIDFSSVSSAKPEPSYLQFLEQHHNRLGCGWGQLGSGSPLGGDRWSLISCPGDFQLAHRNVWYGIKGFEESLLYRGYTDSNVQRKADYYGFRQALIRSIYALHFSHYPGSGSTGGNSARWNDANESLFHFSGTKNRDDWGLADVDFKEEII
jgi:hypothetical protein